VRDWKPKLVSILIPVSADIAGLFSLDDLTRFENIQVVARLCDLHFTIFVMNLKERLFNRPIKKSAGAHLFCNKLDAYTNSQNRT